MAGFSNTASNDVVNSVIQQNLGFCFVGLLSQKSIKNYYFADTLLLTPDIGCTEMAGVSLRV